MILKHLVRGNIPLNISLVMLTVRRGISSDGTMLPLHARGGGTDVRILQKRTYVPDFEEQTFLFMCGLLQPNKKAMEPTKRGRLATLVGLEPTAFEYLYRNA